MGIFELKSLGCIKACVDRAGRLRDGVLVMKEQDALHGDCPFNTMSHGDLAITHSNGPDKVLSRLFLTSFRHLFNDIIFQRMA